MEFSPDFGCGLGLVDQRGEPIALPADAVEATIMRRPLVNGLGMGLLTRAKVLGFLYKRLLIALDARQKCAEPFEAGSLLHHRRMACRRRGGYRPAAIAEPLFCGDLLLPQTGDPGLNPRGFFFQPVLLPRPDACKLPKHPRFVHGCQPFDNAWSSLSVVSSGDMLVID